MWSYTYFWYSKPGKTQVSYLLSLVGTILFSLVVLASNASAEFVRLISFVVAFFGFATLSKPNVKAAAQLTKEDDYKEPGVVVSEVLDVENGQVAENPRQRLGQDDRPAALGDKGKKGIKKVKDISELLADMNAANFEMILCMVSSVGTKMEEKKSKMFGKAQTKSSSTVSRHEDVDEPAVLLMTSDPVSNTDEGDDGVSCYDDEQDVPTGQADPLGLETNDGQQDDDVMSIFPRDSESFLGNAEFLPIVTKQAKARSLLFAVAECGGGSSGILGQW